MKVKKKQPKATYVLTLSDQERKWLSALADLPDHESVGKRDPELRDFLVALVDIDLDDYSCASDYFDGVERSF